jgi:hypothetical protein
MAKDYLE